VLIQKNFFSYFAGNLVSNVGTWFQNIAQVILIYRLTRSAFMVGVVNFAQFVPILLFTPYAGKLADRFDRRRIVIISALWASAVAGAMAVLQLTGRLTAGMTIVGAFLIGITTAFNAPTLHSLVPSLVPADHLRGAAALHSANVNLGRTLGPALGALVVAKWGVGQAFAINAVSFFGLGIAIFLLRPAVIRKGDGPVRLRDTARLIRTDIRLWAPIVLVAMASVATDPVATLTPVLAEQVYGSPDTYAGLLIGAFGLGAVTAAFALIRRYDASINAMAVSLAVACLGIGALSLITNGQVALVALVIAGGAYLATVATSTAWLHVTLDDEHRGRVMAAWAIGFFGLRPVASLIDGALANAFGPRAAAGLIVLPPLIVALWLARRSAHLRPSKQRAVSAAEP
jgi:MFS family permease